jgi:hypothetical protein
MLLGSLTHLALRIGDRHEKVVSTWSPTPRYMIQKV